MSKPRMIGPSAFIVGAAGLIIGAVAAWLVSQGNPGNMGLCIACFVRDIAGAFGGANANMGGVAYIRPEIIGLVLGAAGTSLAFREFKPRGGSAVPLRFVLGFIFMASALIFLGCTVRAWLRLGGGDLNALYGIAGIVVGVGIGAMLLTRGMNLGRAGKLPAWLGWIGVAVFGVLLVFSAMSAFGTAPGFLTTTPANAKSPAPGVVVAADGSLLKPADAEIVEGAVIGADGSVLADAEKVKATKPFPGGKRAPFVISLIAGLALGAVAQRSRFCSMGGIRDAILIRRFDLLFAVLGLLVGAAIVNLALGQFNVGFTGQPVAHTNALGNFAAMVVAGLSAVMLGGCPFRQVIMTGEGDADAGVATFGMFSGALFAHWFTFASTPAGLAPNAWPFLAIMFVVLLAIAFVKTERA